MSFVNALPWVGLLALPLLPVLLHLLTRRHVPTVALPTFRFLVASYAQQRRRTQFWDMALLLLRMGFIAGLLLLLVRPVIERSSSLLQHGSGRTILLLVDCSASMGISTNGQTALERAKETAKQIAGRGDAQDQVLLVRVAARADVVGRARAGNASDLATQIDALTLAPTRANLLSALQLLFTETPLTNTPTVYFLTDTQANSFHELEQQPATFLPPGTAFVLVDVGTAKPGPNLAVIGAAPTSQRALVGLPMTLQATVVNHAKEPADALLTLLVNDQEVERQRLSLGANETITHRFAPYIPTQVGPLRAAFTLTNARPDTFVGDNQFLFALQVEPALKVLLVNGAPHPDPYENESLYLRAALRAERLNQDDGPLSPLRDRAAALAVTEETEADWKELDDAQLHAKFAPYAVIILANCGKLHQIPGAFAALRNFVQEGGGLIIAPGEHVLPYHYNTAFFPTPLPLRDELTPARLAVQSLGELDDATTYRKFARLATSHPIFAAFNATTEAKYFERILIKRHWPLTLPAAKNAVVLAEYTDRTPAIVLSRFGAGQVLLTGFPFNARWTNWPLHGVEFVPFLLRAVTELQRRSPVDGPAVVNADDPALLNVAESWAPVRGQVTTPEGKEHSLRFERFGGRQVAAFDATGTQGYYTANVRGSAAQQATLFFAVNLAAAEADPTRATLDAVQTCLPTANVTHIDQSAEATQAARWGTPPRELWRSIIILLLGVMGVEWWSATARGGRTRATTARN